MKVLSGFPYLPYTSLKLDHRAKYSKQPIQKGTEIGEKKVDKQVAVLNYFVLRNTEGLPNLPQFVFIIPVNQRSLSLFTTCWSAAELRPLDF